MRLWDKARRFFTGKGLTINRVDDGTGFIPQNIIGQYLMGSSSGLMSNVVMAPVLWIMRTFTEAVVRVQSRSPERIWEFVDDHPADLLVNQPNPYYNGGALWKATTISYTLDGNAYWRKVRNSFGGVIQLWYLPHWLVNPVYPTDGSQFISHYEVHGMGSQPERLLPRDVVHFRFGLDPENPRRGLSPLRPLLQEVYTDDEAASFSAHILKNMGVPGLILSPKSDGLPSPAEADKLKAYVQASFAGRGRGQTMVLGKATDVHQFGFDPGKLMLGDLRDIAEERVCAMLGIPAAVVGFGSGLQSTKVGATMRELVKLAWVQCLNPMQTDMADQITAQLLPDFVSQTRRFRFRFDTSEAAAFQEEDDLRAKRAAILVQAGILRIDRAQEIVGLEVDPTRKVYLQPSNAIPIGEDGTVAEDAMPAKPDPETPGTPMADPTMERTGPVDENTKMLDAIAERHGFRNGNGSHG